MLKFPGFPSQALRFFRELEKNNDRTWFASHKELFDEQVRRPMVELVTLLDNELRGFAPDYVPEKPEKAIYRIYRDTRFSKDTTPYKLHISAHFQHRRIEKNRGAGFYFEVSHTSVGIGGGMYMPEPEQLAAVRQALLSQHEAFTKLVTDKSLVKAHGPLQGETLARVPKAYAPAHPAAGYLRMKQYYYFCELDAKLATTPKLLTEILSRFRKLTPFNNWLNDAILAAIQLEEPARPQRPEPMF